MINFENKKAPKRLFHSNLHLLYCDLSAGKQVMTGHGYEPVMTENLSQMRFLDCTSLDSRCSEDESLLRRIS